MSVKSIAFEVSNVDIGRFIFSRGLSVTGWLQKSDVFLFGKAYVMSNSIYYINNPLPKICWLSSNVLNKFKLRN